MAAVVAARLGVGPDHGHPPLVVAVAGAAFRTAMMRWAAGDDAPAPGRPRRRGVRRASPPGCPTRRPTPDPPVPARPRRISSGASHCATNPTRKRQ